MIFRYDDLDMDAAPEPAKKVQSLGPARWAKMRNEPTVTFNQAGDGRWIKTTVTTEVMPEGFEPPLAEVRPIGSGSGRKRPRRK